MGFDSPFDCGILFQTHNIHTGNESWSAFLFHLSHDTGTLCRQVYTYAALFQTIPLSFQKENFSKGSTG